MKLNPKYFWLAVFMALVFSCKEENKLENQIADIPVQVSLARFDIEFAKATPKDLPALKRKYPYLFPERFPDSIWVAKMGDTIQHELSEEVAMGFGDFETETEQLRGLFQHLRYYFPGMPLPKVVTMTSDVEYNNRVILTDSLLLIGLDNYLGKDHRFYQRIPRYVAKGLDKQFLVADVASAFAKAVNRYPRNRTFLSRMVYHGKELYLKEMLLPDFPEAAIIGYETDEMEWAAANEAQMWRYFIERELLYSTESGLDRRFLDPAPFSKFQLELDTESPGRLGRYIGWQIVRSFAKNRPEVPLTKLLVLPADELFKEANYKPKK